MRNRVYISLLVLMLAAGIFAVYQEAQAVMVVCEACKSQCEGPCGGHFRIMECTYQSGQVCLFICEYVPSFPCGGAYGGFCYRSD